jgi:hypothetical protein
MMKSGRLIFLESKVNNGVYDGDRIPSLSWNWPKGTWFQTRLRYLRSNENDVMEITVRQFE